jgi:hypothetical protein
VNTVIVHLSPYAADIGRLNSANEPQGRSVSVRLFFNPQHWSAIPFSAVARYRHKIMDPLRKAVGKDSANPGECASIIGLEDTGPFVVLLWQLIIGCRI